MQHKTPFTQTLGYLNKGALTQELTDKLSEVVKAVRETGKQGTLTLTLKIGMFNRNSDDMVKITPQVKSVTPEADRPEAIMWSTESGSLLREDPDKPVVELRSVDESAKLQAGQLKQTQGTIS